MPISVSFEYKRAWELCFFFNQALKDDFKYHIRIEFMLKHMLSLGHSESMQTSPGKNERKCHLK